MRLQFQERDKSVNGRIDIWYALSWNNTELELNPYLL